MWNKLDDGSHCHKSLFHSLACAARDPSARLAMTTSPQFLSAPIAPFIPSNVFYDIPSDGSAYSNDDEESDEELFDGEAVFSVEQDVFLVQQCCFYPETRAADLASKFEREFGISRDGHVLDDRLQKLESPEFRALLALYLKAVTHSKGGGHVTLGALPKYQPLLDCTRTTCEARLFQLIYEDEKLRHEACEFVTLEVAGRTFPKVRLLSAPVAGCCSDHLHGILGAVLANCAKSGAETVLQDN